MQEVLSEAEVRAALPEGGAWRLDGGRLVLERKFGDFSEAFAFLARVALLAEKANHHPDLYNSYATVRLELHSHDAGGITQRDLDLAQKVSPLLSD